MHIIFTLLQECELKPIPKSTGKPEGAGSVVKGSKGKPSIKETTDGGDGRSKNGTIDSSRRKNNTKDSGGKMNGTMDSGGKRNDGNNAVKGRGSVSAGDTPTKVSKKSQASSGGK